MHRLFSVLPFGETLHHASQRFLTRSLPASRDAIQKRASYAARHLAAFRSHGPAVADPHFFEFGAGYELPVPLALYGLGVNRQTVVDQRRLARPALLRSCANHLAHLERPPSDDLQAMGIDYRAPADARATGLPAGSVDCVSSTATLEHIPEAEIRAIHAECFRLLGPGGIMSHVIDYQDHYGFTDTSIDVYHFMRFEDAEWERFNPPHHYQNRLRHGDHVALIRSAGFEIVADGAEPVPAADLEAVRATPLAARFRGLPAEALAIRTGAIVARKPPHA